MTTDTATALDAVDRFIRVGEDLAHQQALSDPRYAGALDSLVEVVQILLAANENMAGWLNRFTQFNFRAHDSRQDFMRLVADYNTAKSGADLRLMKWPCSEIRRIYDTDIRVAVADMFVQTEPIPAQLDEAFKKLGNSDEDMVSFIYDTVVGGINSFLAAAEPAVDADDLDAAELARLEFKVDARALSERLERLGGGLADLLLRYARLSGRPVKVPR